MRNRFEEILRQRANVYGAQLSESSIEQLSAYYKLIEKWNPRLHLVAPCSPEEFATRHVLESFTMLPYVPAAGHVIDIGSGAGLPIIPCLIARPDIRATLIEASGKKAVFLREALKQTTSAEAQVVNERFETIKAPSAEAVSCRALERFQELLPRIVEWSPKESTLLFFGGEGTRNSLDQMKLTYSSQLMPGTDNRFLYVVQASASDA